MIQSFFKRNGILLVTALVYLASVAGIVFVTDAMVYQVRKRDILLNYTPQEIFPNAVSDFLEKEEVLRRDLAKGRLSPELREFLESESRQILNGPTSIYQIVIKDNSGNVLFQDQVDKFREFFDFRTSLWLPNFSTVRGVNLGHPTQPGERAGTYLFYFTTPRSLPEESAWREMIALTTQFRWLTILMVAVVTLLTLLFVRTVLLPARSVIEAIEGSTVDHTRIIRKPTSHLEVLYNDMARDTVLARTQEHLGNHVQEGGAVTGWELIEAAVTFLVDQIDEVVVGWIEMFEDDEKRLRAGDRLQVHRGQRAPTGFEEEPFIGAVAETAAAMRRNDLGSADRPRPKPKTWAFPGAPAFQYVKDPEQDARYFGFGLLLSVEPDRERDAHILLDRFVVIVQRGLEALLARHRTLEQERGRASINLSRNLGHDLTNIIATTKLDLQTLSALIGDGAPPPEGARREILKESLSGLLNSTRFLQEVVNLYRAYAFLKRPVFERHDALELTNETVRLFKLSTSEGVDFEVAATGERLECNVDPRLVKLALFNLFTNAIDSIRRVPGNVAVKGKIMLKLERLASGDVRIAVQDSGLGIRNQWGEPANPEEIERIFSLGYSRGRDSEGEGLGLNWVRTIVCDIHGGSIHAENAPEGGARFSLTFPSA